MNKKVWVFNQAQVCLHVHLVLGMAFEVVPIFSDSRAAAAELLALYLATFSGTGTNKILKHFSCLLCYCG